MPVIVNGSGAQSLVNGVGGEYGGGASIEEYVTADASLVIPGTEVEGDIAVNNTSADNTTVATAEMAGGDAVDFDVSDDTGIIPPSTSSSVTVERTGGTPGTTIQSTCRLRTPLGTVIDVPVSAVIPDTLENQALNDGADHIYAFADLTDTGASPAANLVLAGSASLIATSVPGCKGDLRLATYNTDHATIQTGVEGGWVRGNSSDRTWEFVFTINELATRNLWREGWLYNYSNMAFQIGAQAGVSSLHLMGSTWAVWDTLSELNSSELGNVIYLAVLWDYSAGTVTAKYRTAALGSLVTGPSATKAAASYGSEKILFGGNHSNDHSLDSSFHHFAVYPSLLSDGQIATRTAILGLH